MQTLYKNDQVYQVGENFSKNWKWLKTLPLFFCWMDNKSNSEQMTQIFNTPGTVKVQQQKSEAPDPTQRENTSSLLLYLLKCQKFSVFPHHQDFLLLPLWTSFALLVKFTLEPQQNPSTSQSTVFSGRSEANLIRSSHEHARPYSRLPSYKFFFSLCIISSSILLCSICQLLWFTS